MQVPNKLVMRSSQKMSSSAQMLEQLFSAVFWCERHRPSQLCQRQPPATGLPCTIRISSGKPEPFGNLRPRDLLPVSALAEFCPRPASLPAKTRARVLLPAFPFFKSLFFLLHILQTHVMPPLSRFTYSRAPCLSKI